MDWDRLFTTYQLPLTIASILLGAVLLARFTRWLLLRWFNHLYNDDRGSATALNFMKNTVTAFFLTVAIFAVVYSIPALRTLAAGLTAGAGIIAAVAAFASQAALANLIGGVFIVIFRPFRVNDRITIGNLYEGHVEDITLRHTVIRSWEHKRIVIPNSVISKETIVNNDLADDLTCRFTEIPISYDADLQQAIAIIRELVVQHPRYVDVRTPQEKSDGEPAVQIRVIRYTDSGAVLRVYLWGDMSHTFVMACDLREQLHLRLARVGIRLGVPHRLWYGEAARSGPLVP